MKLLICRRRFFSKGFLSGRGRIAIRRCCTIGWWRCCDDWLRIRQLFSHHIVTRDIVCCFVNDLFGVFCWRQYLVVGSESERRGRKKRRARKPGGDGRREHFMRSLPGRDLYLTPSNSLGALSELHRCTFPQ